MILFFCRFVSCERYLHTQCECMRFPYQYSPLRRLCVNETPSPFMCLFSSTTLVSILLERDYEFSTCDEAVLMLIADYSPSWAHSYTCVGTTESIWHRIEIK